MAYIKNDDGTFTVTSRSKPNVKWIVSESILSCNCPKFRYILKGQGKCHHMEEVELGEAKISQALEKATDTDNFAKFDRRKYFTPISVDKFIEVFGESQYRVLIATAEIFMQRGLVRLI